MVQGISFMLDAVFLHFSQNIVQNYISAPGIITHILPLIQYLQVVEDVIGGLGWTVKKSSGNVLSFSKWLHIATQESIFPLPWTQRRQIGRGAWDLWEELSWVVKHGELGCWNPHRHRCNQCTTLPIQYGSVGSYSVFPISILRSFTSKSAVGLLMRFVIDESWHSSYECTVCCRRISDIL